MDIVKVWGINAGTLGIVTLSDLEIVLKIILLVSSITYTVIKSVKALSGGDDKSAK
jgi:hypothetical protein